MQITDITITDFKSLFTRDFPFLISFDAVSFYNEGEQVYYPTTRLFYTALKDGVASIPTTEADWVKVTDNAENYISDDDIQKAFNEAICNCNPAIFEDDNSLKLAFCFLSAHYLCLDIRTSQQGLGSKGEFVTASKGVGSVSESVAIPQTFLTDPFLSYFTKTEYGNKYLSLLVTRLRGNMGIAMGATTA